MDIVVTAINAAVVGAVGLALWWTFRGRFEALEKRMDGLESRIDRFEASVQVQLDSFRSEIMAMRSDLTMVALAVGAKPRAGNA